MVLTLLVLTLTMRELRHWPSIAGMSPQSHCGDDKDGCIGLSSRRHYIFVYIYKCVYVSCLLMPRLSLLLSLIQQS